MEQHELLALAGALLVVAQRLQLRWDGLLDEFESAIDMQSEAALRELEDDQVMLWCERWTGEREVGVWADNGDHLAAKEQALDVVWSVWKRL